MPTSKATYSISNSSTNRASKRTGHGSWDALVSVSCWYFAIKPRGSDGVGKRHRFVSRVVAFNSRSPVFSLVAWLAEFFDTRTLMAITLANRYFLLARVSCVECDVHFVKGCVIEMNIANVQARSSLVTLPFHCPIAKALTLWVSWLFPLWNGCLLTLQLEAWCSWRPLANAQWQLPSSCTTQAI